jgi:hypothetical protein
MTFTYTLDLSRYTDNQVALMMVEGVITRREFEQWRASKTALVNVVFQLTDSSEQESPRFV